MVVVQTVYGKENDFISLPYCVRWLAFELEISERTATKLLREKICTSTFDSFYIDIYGRFIDGLDIEFYLVANNQKIYFPSEAEYIQKVFLFLEMHGAYNQPQEDDIKFFYNLYYIKRNALYSLLNIKEQHIKNTDEIILLNEKIANLEKQLKQAQSSQFEQDEQREDEPQGRISKPQRALFSLLLNKLYPDGKIPNVNSVKEAINTELKKIGLSEVSYNTIAGLMKKT